MNERLNPFARTTASRGSVLPETQAARDPDTAFLPRKRDGAVALGRRVADARTLFKVPRTAVATAEPHGYLGSA